MSDLKFRPRFKIETSLAPEIAEAKISHKLRTQNTNHFESRIVKGHMMLSIAEEKRHFWSPQLDISVDNHQDSSITQVRCLLAPAPTVWTMFVFFYALAGFGALVGAMIGGSQLSLDKTPWGFWIAGGSLGLGLLLFAIAQIGKVLSHEEMQQLKAFVMEMDWPE